MVLSPTAKAMAGEADPLATVLPFTVIVEPAAAAVGVTVMEFTLLATEAVYDVVLEANAGVSVPLLKLRPERSALFETPLPDKETERLTSSNRQVAVPPDVAVPLKP